MLRAGRRAGTQDASASSSRSKVAYPQSSRRAASDLLIRPASNSARTAAHRYANPDLAVTGGRPTCFPSRLARSMPALTLSRRIPRSSCA